MLALILYEHGRISVGKSCELGGFSHWEFAAMNRELMIPIHDGALDLADDLARLRDAELCRRRLVRPDRPGED
jgi:predicted HTH domain antitoxin